MPKQMSDGERWKAIGMLTAGSSYRAVGRHFGRAPNTIRNLWIKTRVSGTVEHASKRLKRRHTTVRADRRLLRIVRGNPNMPATLLRLMWGEQSFRGNTLSAQTIRRRLKEGGFRCRKMRKMPRLSPAHVAHRERWAMQRVHWRLQQWRRVIFTDESRFRLFRADGRIRVWRQSSQELWNNHVQQADRQGVSLHVWAGITMHRRTELVFLNRSVSASSYGDLIQTRVLPFMQNEFNGADNCILQDDNAPPHRAASVRQLKANLGIRTLKWPSRSPDLNPIEHVWSYLKRQITMMENPPQNVVQLRQALNTCWNEMPRTYIRRLILGMPRRVTSVLLARGGYTRY